MTVADHGRLRSEFHRTLTRGRQAWALIARPHKLALCGAALLMLLTSGVNTGVALLLGGLVDRIQHGLENHESRELLYVAAGNILFGLAVAYVVREVLNVGRRQLVYGSCTGINRDMQTRLVGHLLAIDLNLLAQDRVGALHGRIVRSVDGLVRFVRLMCLDCLPAVFTGLFALSAAVSKHPLLGILMTGVIPVSVFLTLRQLAAQHAVRLALMRDCEEIDGIIVEQLGGAEYIRVADTKRYELQRLSQATGKHRQRELQHHFAMSLFGCGKALNEALFYILVLGLSTYWALHQTISFGDILTFSLLFGNVMAPLNEIHRVVDEGHEASLCVGDLLSMLQIPVDRAFLAPATRCVQFNADVPAIRVQDLVVHYDSAAAPHAARRGLSGLGLQIRHGETIGVAGPSGSGKSTWIKTLLRLLHPAAGRIEIGDQPLDALNRAELARLVGYVGQTPFIFSGSIRDNIVYGHWTADDAAVHRVARLAHLHDEILAMPLGYQTPVAERGQNLSGGQRQRLAIARVLLSQAPILILDEATSALDNISERYVQAALRRTKSDRTTIMIAHRLTTLKDCNRILVIDDGRIVEEGTYDDLVRCGGLFSRLAASGENGSIHDDLAPAAP